MVLRSVVRRSEFEHRHETPVSGSRRHGSCANTLPPLQLHEDAFRHDINDTQVEEVFPDLPRDDKGGFDLKADARKAFLERLDEQAYQAMIEESPGLVGWRLQKS